MTKIVDDGNKKINIVGFESLGLLNYSSFKKDIVKIGGKYYMKNSSLLCKINNRFYRKESELISIDDYGNYYLKRESDKLFVSVEGVKSIHLYDFTETDEGLTVFPVPCVNINSGREEVTIRPLGSKNIHVCFSPNNSTGKGDTFYFSSTEENKIKVKKKDVEFLFKNKDKIRINLENLLYSLPSFDVGRYWFDIKFTFNNEKFNAYYHGEIIADEIFSSEFIYINPEKFKFVNGRLFIKDRIKLEINDNTSFVSKEHFLNSCTITEENGNFIKDSSFKPKKIEDNNKSLKPLAYEFDFSDGKRKLNTVFIPKRTLAKYRDSLFYSNDLFCYFFNEDKDFVKSKIEELKINSSMLMHNYINSLLKKYPKDIIDENSHSPLLAKITSGRVRGGETYYEPIIKKNPLSLSKSKVGNINYTFGVEFETSFGEPLPHILDEHSFKKVGDSSMYDESLDIMSYEYVSSILHGNKGISSIMKFSDKLKKYCAISDKCAIHIHVGGSNNTDKPSFNKEFAHAAIKLGTKIEKELFSLLPARRNNNKYCKSILDYKGIDKNNLKAYLASYVFEKSSLDKSYNKKSRLNRWTSSRYKWLNLVNFMSDNSSHGSRGDGFKTIEFRAFHATYDKDYILFFILFSLAFVWFIENKQSESISNKKITLMDIFNSAIKGREKESLLNFLNKFIETKKQSLCAV
jgi:hypothetical protein